ncbi:BgtAcSP-31194 [Blumeria graminis f. sp. tritici]|uniref:BgtAcSP-31194 n=2 Tax=Blumeria graminis f. sp. tritici TaxID=62690 RepID=A0A9X9ML88_BLUGR|nr:hypothetical protein BGT96224_AcSP31194 [Blumeria graminis f. sp. tritici 96224]VDB91371.1 BgtAcSP-31194 [Blumeria graminis f. sp. tritici]
MVYRLFFLISLVEFWDNQVIYTYNVVYPANQGASIQYFSNEDPKTFTLKQAISPFQYFSWNKPKLMSLNDPSAYYATQHAEDFSRCHSKFMQLKSESSNLAYESMINSKHEACADQFKIESQKDVISISNILARRLSKCKARLIIELIHSGQIRVVKPGNGCKTNSQKPCIVVDRTIPLQTLVDGYEALTSVNRNGINGYLVAISGKLKVILQKSGKEHVIVPMHSDEQNAVIFRFLSSTLNDRIPGDKPTLRSAVIDLHNSSTDEAVSLFDNFVNNII